MNPVQINFIFCLIISTNDVLCQISNASENNSMIKEDEKSSNTDTSNSKDFAHILKHSPAFVDKTHFIENLFVTRRIILSAPRHFGKSVTLSMLKYFYELEISKETGYPITKFDIHKEPITDTENYKLFQNLAVTRDHANFTKNHFGKYPVIFLDFSRTTPINSYEDAFNHFRNVNHQAYKYHSYLINSTILTEEETDRMKKYSDVNEYTNFTSDHYNYEFARDIVWLSKFLRRHLGRDSVILVDEYDSVYRNALVNTNESTFIACRRLYQCFLEGIFIGRVETAPMAHGIMSGISHLAINESRDLEQFIKMNTFTRHVCSQDIDEYSDLHGFTKQEFDLIMDKNNIPDHQRQQAARYYNGYCSLEGTTKLYNPSSVAKFVDTKVVKGYWSDSKFFEKYRHLLDLEKTDLLVKKLIFGQNVSVNLLGNMMKPSMVDDLHDIDSGRGEEYFPSFLYERGYLRIVEHCNRTLIHEDEVIQSVRGHLKIVKHLNRTLNIEDIVVANVVNEEIKMYLIEELRKYYQSSEKFDWESMQDCIRLFDNIDFTNEKICEQNLHEIYSSMENYFNVFFTKTWKENFGKQSVLRLIYNLLIFTKYKTKIGLEVNDIVLDVDMVSDSGSIAIQVGYDGNSQEILDQIRAKNRDGKTKYLLIGINLSKTKQLSMSAVVNDGNLNRTMTFPRP